MGMADMCKWDPDWLMVLVLQPIEILSPLADSRPIRYRYSTCCDDWSQSDAQRMSWC